MTRQPVQSSNILAIGHDPDTSDLEIEFTSGDVYRYAGVPAAVHVDLMAAASIGRYFAQVIKGRYADERIACGMKSAKPARFKAAVATSAAPSDFPTVSPF